MTMRPDPLVLLGYHDEAHEQTVDYVRGVTDGELHRVIDTSWDPPVTIGVRWVSVIADGLQHTGQAAFMRGIAVRR